MVAYGMCALVIVGLITFAVVPIADSAGTTGDVETSHRDEELHGALAHMVEEAQEDLWQFREPLLADAVERHGGPVPLGDLTVRRTVTAADFQPLPCQCHSGGSCECPGG